MRLSLLVLFRAQRMTMGAMRRQLLEVTVLYVYLENFQQNITAWDTDPMKLGTYITKVSPNVHGLGVSLAYHCRPRTIECSYGNYRFFDAQVKDGRVVSPKSVHA